LDECESCTCRHREETWATAEGGIACINGVHTAVVPNMTQNIVRIRGMARETARGYTVHIVGQTNTQALIVRRYGAAMLTDEITQTVTLLIEPKGWMNDD